MKMKKIIKVLFTVSLVAFSFSNLQAQKQIQVVEVNEKINNAEGNALQVHINKSSDKVVSKEWKKLMKKNGAKVKTKKRDVFATNATIESISEYPIQVFAKITEDKKENYQTLTVIFLNGNIPISKSVDISGYIAAEKILVDFATRVSKEASLALLKAEEKNLKGYNKELKKLEKTNKKAEKTIKSNIKENKKLEKTLEKNNERIETINKEIKSQSSAVKDAQKEVEEYK